ncbi:uncharacterized protein IL334_002718 [Kwoniella shivajii]|uniref:Myb-like domain-containing protein n=1 Tax=Kwoniella shivajii TaxID=564305 RepID=A0ABZ1CVI4_9TREE|nr:hypothetical protein IL334_002718 [Kwoniella shivajii]
MPPTRASAIAGPSRFPYNPSNKTNFNVVIDEEDHLDSPGLASRSRPSRARRSVSFQPQDRTFSTPHANTSRHRRRTSGGSHQSIRLTPPTTTFKHKNKVVVRKSLTGEHVLGMNINDRVEILADVAGDCLVTLVKAVLGSEIRSRRKSLVDDEVRTAWNGLNGIRNSYIFPPYAPPFPSLTDILESLHSQVRATLHAQSLARAISLSNLSTFVWTISRPDEAGGTFNSLDLDDDGPRRSSRRIKGRDAQPDEELLKKVGRRNMLLLIAWKKFWLVVVPQEKRTSEIALRLWLDFATQVALIYQRPHVDDLSADSSYLPEPPRTFLAELFSPSAVGRFGQWSLSEDFDSLDDNEEKEGVEERWLVLAKRRLDELSQHSQQDLIWKYPYDKFRIEMTAYIQHEVLASPINALLTPGRKSLLVGSLSGFPSAQLRITESSSSDEEQDVTQSADWSQDDDILEANEEVDEDERADENIVEDEEADGDVQFLGADDPIDMDLLALAAAEMEAEDEHVQTQHPRSPTWNKVPATMEESASIPILNDISENEDDWTVNDFVPHQSSAYSPIGEALAGNSKPVPKFDWTKRQEDAVQLEWESQSMDGSTRSHRKSLASQVDQGPKSKDSEHLRFATPPIQTQTSPPVPASVVSRLVEIDTQPSPPPIRAERLSLLPRQSILQQDEPAAELATSIDGSEEEERVENATTPPLSDGDMVDILPSPSQLRGIDPPAAARGSARQDSEQLDKDNAYEDLIPAESQFAVGQHPSLRNTDGNHGDEDFPELQDADLDDLRSEHDADTEPAPLSSQGQYISSRPKKSFEAHSFVVPNEEEDMEDRQLFLRSDSFPGTESRDISVKPEPIQDILGLHDFVERLHETYRRQRDVNIPFHNDEDDPFLHDADGSPLESDELFVAPLDEKPTRQSKLHGRIASSSSKYCRLTGNRRWTKEEELLLYRTVQKVPLDEEYPLRVVWALYGEYGREGDALKWYNPQHMKDKLRTTVKRRQNEGREVEGRVRAWAARGTREREEWELEWEEWKSQDNHRQDEEEHEDADEGQENARDQIDEQDGADEGEDDEYSSEPENEEIRQDQPEAENADQAPVEDVSLDDDFPAPLVLDLALPIQQDDAATTASNQYRARDGDSSHIDDDDDFPDVPDIPTFNSAPKSITTSTNMDRSITAKQASKRKSTQVAEDGADSRQNTQEQSLRRDVEISLPTKSRRGRPRKLPAGTSKEFSGAIIIRQSDGPPLDGPSTIDDIHTVHAQNEQPMNSPVMSATLPENQVQLPNNPSRLERRGRTRKSYAIEDVADDLESPSDLLPSETQAKPKRQLRFVEDPLRAERRGRPKKNPRQKRVTHKKASHQSSFSGILRAARKTTEPQIQPKSDSEPEQGSSAVSQTKGPTTSKTMQTARKTVSAQSVQREEEDGSDGVEQEKSLDDPMHSRIPNEEEDFPSINENELPPTKEQVGQDGSRQEVEQRDNGIEERRRRAILHAVMNGAKKNGKPGLRV